MLYREIRLELIPAVVLTKNIQFRDKIFILSTMVDVALPEPDRTTYKKLLRRVDKVSLDRNMIAHKFFLGTRRETGFVFT